MPFSSGLHGFWWEIHCHSNHCFHNGKNVKWYIISLYVLSRFWFWSFVFVSDIWLWYDLEWTSLGLSCLVHSASWIYRIVSFTQLDDVSAIISLIIFKMPSSLSSPTGTLMTQMFNLLSCPTGPYVSVDHLSVYSLLFTLGNFYSSTFNFTNSFLCHLHFSNKLIQ